MNTYHRVHTIVDIIRQLLLNMYPSLPPKFQQDIDALIISLDEFLEDINSGEVLKDRLLTERLVIHDKVSNALLQTSDLSKRATLSSRDTRNINLLKVKVPGVLRRQLERGED